MLTTFYPPFTFGGDGIAVERLSEALARVGHDVTVVHDEDAYRALNGQEPSSAQSNGAGVRVVGLRSGLGRISPLLAHQTGRPVLQRRGLEAILRRGFDVVNFHNVSLLGGPGVLGLGRATKLYLAHEHWLVCPTHVLWRHEREPCPARQCIRCTLRHRRPPQLWRYTGVLERRLHHIDAFVARSEFSRRKHAEFGFPRAMEVLPFCLADDAPRASTPPPHPRPYVLFAGRLERLKGLDDVVPLFRAGLGVDLLVAGEGSHGPALRRLAAGSSAVRFLGRLHHAELGPFYRHALALLAPSVGFETFGCTLIEAFRAGTPVLARAQGPHPEIMDRAGEAGFLFSRADELPNLIAGLAGEPELRARLGRAGRAAFLRHWSEDTVVPLYLDIVERARARREARVSGVT
jgi:glycosyltransferase involved in cell wall biosynthesis